MKKIIARRPFVLTLLGVVFIAGAIALGQGVTRTGRVAYIPVSATNPFTPPESGTYFNSVDKTEHSVDSTGLDRTTVDTLQTAYNNTPNSDGGAKINEVFNKPIGITSPNPDMGAVNITINNCAIVPNDPDLGTIMPSNGCYATQATNTAPSTNTGETGSRPSPFDIRCGTTNDTMTTIPDCWSTGGLPLFNGSDTGRWSLRHNITGSGPKGWNNVFNVITQGEQQMNYTLKELILNTDYLNMCEYIGATDTLYAGIQARSGRAFHCLNGNVWSMGASLGSPNAISGGPSAAVAPGNNGVAVGGGIATQFGDWFSTFFSTFKDNWGEADPSATVVRRVVNSQPAVNGLQQYSGSDRFVAQGFNTALNISEPLSTFFQLEPTQETTAPATGNGCFWTANGSGRHRSFCVNSTQAPTDNAFGGALFAEHLENIGANSSIAFGAAANCATAASATAIDGGDLGGNFSFTTGGAVCAAGTIATVSYHNPFVYKGFSPVGGPPRLVAIVPANANAAIAMATSQIYWNQGSSTNGGFVVTAGAPLVAATTYVFGYSVIR